MYCWYKRIEGAYLGPFCMAFDPLCLGGQNHKNRDCSPNTAPNCFVVLGVQLSKSIHDLFALPTSSCSRITCQRLRGCFLTFFALTPGAPIYFARDFTHTRSALYRTDGILYYTLSVIMHAPRELSSSGDRTVSILSPSPRSYWGEFVFPKHTLVVRIPRVFVRLQWVHLFMDWFFGIPLPLTSGLSPQFLHL